MNEKKYFQALLIKTARVYPLIGAITVLLLTVIITFSALILQSYNNSSDKIRYRFGLVGNTADRYLDVGLATLKNLDSSRFSVEINEMEKAEAIRGVMDGTLLGYIDIPDSFVSDIDRGVDTTLYLIMKQGNTTFGSMMIREIADLVSNMAIRSQSAVFTVGDISIGSGAKKSSDLMNQLSFSLALNAVSRHEMSETEIIGISNHLSMGGYYIGGALTVFLLLWGISCCEILFKKKMPVQRLLYGNNIGAIKQILCEYAVYLIATVIMLLAVFTVAGTVTSRFDFGIGEIADINVIRAWRLLIACLPVVLLFTSLQFLLYECITSRIAVIVWQFFLTTVLGYISGCFYPSYFFPKQLQRIAAHLPVGAGFSYIKGILSAEVDRKAVLLVCVYIALFGMLTVIVRKRRLEGDT